MRTQATQVSVQSIKLVKDEQQLYVRVQFLSAFVWDKVRFLGLPYSRSFLIALPVLRPLQLEMRSCQSWSLGTPL